MGFVLIFIFFYEWATQRAFKRPPLVRDLKGRKGKVTLYTTLPPMGFKLPIFYIPFKELQGGNMPLSYNSIIAEPS